mgnify:CR=1 FL=1
MRSSNSLWILALSLWAAALGIAVMFASGAPIPLGRYIPQSDLMADYAYGVIAAVICYAFIMICPVNPLDRIALLVVWSIKVTVALVFMLFYENFYWFLDSYSYFAEPRLPSFSWDGLIIGQGTENIYNLIWLYYRVFPESFHTLKVLFGFAGLWAVYLFYRAAVLVLGRPDLRLLYLLSLFPSILFWSSTLGKEPIALLGIGLYAYGAVAWYGRGRPGALILLSVGVVIAVLVRPWLGPILLVPLLIKYLFARHGILTKAVVIAFGMGALAYTLALVWEQFAIETTRDLLESLDVTSRQFSFGGSGQELAADLTQPLQLIAALPLAMFTALFRPLPGEIANVFGFLAGIENLALLALLAVAIKRFRRTDLNDPAITWAVLLILVWTLAYAFISYQNLGTAIRFRLQILPVLLAALLYFARNRAPGRMQTGDDSQARVTPGT